MGPFLIPLPILTYVRAVAFKTPFCAIIPLIVSHNYYESESNYYKYYTTFSLFTLLLQLLCLAIPLSLSLITTNIIQPSPFLRYFYNYCVSQFL